MARAHAVPAAAGHWAAAVLRGHEVRGVGNGCVMRPPCPCGSRSLGRCDSAQTWGAWGGERMCHTPTLSLRQQVIGPLRFCADMGCMGWGTDVSYAHPVSVAAGHWAAAVLRRHEVFGLGRARRGWGVWWWACPLQVLAWNGYAAHLLLLLLLL